MPIHDMLLGLGGVTHQGLQSRLQVSVSYSCFQYLSFSRTARGSSAFQEALVH